MSNVPLCQVYLYIKCNFMSSVPLCQMSLCEMSLWQVILCQILLIESEELKKRNLQFMNRKIESDTALYSLSISHVAEVSSGYVQTGGYDHGGIQHTVPPLNNITIINMI